MRGATEPWSGTAAGPAAGTGRYTPDEEACVDCLVSKTRAVYERALDRALPTLPLEEAILGADSLLRLRGAEENKSLMNMRDYDFGVELLTKALAKVPEGATLAKRMVDEEIGPRELLARLRELHVLQ